MGEARVVALRDRAAAAAGDLEAELDAVQAGGLLLDPGALRRLRAVVDRALPVAEEYEQHVAGQWRQGEGEP